MSISLTLSSNISIWKINNYMFNLPNIANIVSFVYLRHSYRWSESLIDQKTHKGHQLCSNIHWVCYENIPLKWSKCFSIRVSTQSQGNLWYWLTFNPKYFTWYLLHAQYTFVNVYVCLEKHNLPKLRLELLPRAKSHCPKSILHLNNKHKLWKSVSSALADTV